jgi:ferredoxin
MAISREDNIEETRAAFSRGSRKPHRMSAATEATSPASVGEQGGSSTPGGPVVFASRGWTAASEACEPKIVALAALATLPPPPPVPSVSYVSRGNLLVIAGDVPERARDAATALAGTLHVTMLSREPLPAPGVTAWTGSLESLEGHLGEFTAIVAGLRKAAGTPAKFDLVLDFGAQPAFSMRMPPQGYFRVADDDAELARTLEELRGAVGEFEKPRYFAYRENLCAHSRSQIEGCNACIEICSTGAIRADGDHVKVDPHLCMGCGTCATVCPSGAMGYQYPRPEDRGAQVKRLISAYRSAGGVDACVVLHGADGRELLARAAATGSGLPPRALPLEAWSVVANGLDVLLAAIAYGASQVVVLSAGMESAEELAAVQEQMAIGQAVLSALGYAGRHFEVLVAREPAAIATAFAALSPAAAPVPATFALSNDKRTAIEFSIEHLAKHAVSRPEAIELPAGAPFGQVLVDKKSCTLCMSCVGACPASALMDGGDNPMLKFLERNCVQCGLCEATCPEDAIRLEPRLLLTPAVREARVLNETQPFHCVRCQKPFGTRQMVEAMMGRLAGHSMFAGGDALRRLQMCADCRVVDMMESKNEASVLRLGADS